MTIFCTVVSIQLFNLSFDPADTFYGKEDLSINEVESCVEFILENILGYDNAVQETDESDEAPDRPGPMGPLFRISESVLLEQNQSIEIKSFRPGMRNTHHESLSLPITSPPPRG